MGMTVGDKAAPIVFGGDSDSVKDKHGQYYGHTGNDTIDHLIDGGHDISNGDYADGAKAAGLGALGGVETMLDPTSGMTSRIAESLKNEPGSSTVDKLENGGKDLAKDVVDAEDIVPGLSTVNKTSQKVGGWIGKELFGKKDDDSE